MVINTPPHPVSPFSMGKPATGRGEDKIYFLKSHEGGVRSLNELEKIEKIKNRSRYKNIRKSIKEQLKNDGKISSHYEDLVEDYMKMYLVKELAYADIQERGETVEWHNGTQRGFKKNDSVDVILKTNQQMLKLLDTLGIKPDVSGADDFEL